MAFQHPPSFHPPQSPVAAPDMAQVQAQALVQELPQGQPHGRGQAQEPPAASQIHTQGRAREGTQGHALSQSQTRAQIQPLQSQPVAENEGWVVFSDAGSATDGTYLASTGCTPRAGRSHISDFGSAQSAARSYAFDEESEHAEGALDDDEDGEDGELDSLDSHLHAFRTVPSVYGAAREAELETSGATVLPTHDGLGSFRIDGMMTGEVVQDHLYSFERFNPRRVKRRRQMDGAAEDEQSERALGVERTRRIEAWRMEQSRLLVDEIQRETRRRQSMTSERRSSVEEREQEDDATLSNVEGPDADEVPSEDNESFWDRITKKVIRGLLGVDDDLLSIILGESLPEDKDPSKTPTTSPPFNTADGLIASSQDDQSSWEYRLLERIARELGILVNQLTDHPGAFTTYLHTQTKPLPYAGLPVIPETARDEPPPSHTDPLIPASSPSVEFQPTLQHTTQPISIPQGSTSLSERLLSPEDATPRATHVLSREEWEADLDIKMVFRYLRSRFVSKFVSPPPPSDFHTHASPHLATSHTADAAARAARVRQHHPLVRPYDRERERTRVSTWRATIPSTGGGISREGTHRRRSSSSCASESRMSASALGKMSGSSRHYWDFGPGSVGSGGSLLASTGAMGSWGEV